MAVDRITYVNPDGELFTINPDGTGQLKLTGGTQVGLGSRGAFLAQSLNDSEFYAWPTWSPDGTKVAASRIQVSGGQPRITVEVIGASTGQASTVYTNTVPSLVAQGAPHYLYWSPDSRSLAFLASTPDGLTLFVVDTEAAGPAVAVDSGAPLYFQWAADGNSIAVHIREELKLIRRPFGTDTQSFGRGTLGFRTPALSSDGKRMAYAGIDQTEGSLFIGDVTEPQGATAVLEIGPVAAFTWSPNGAELAVADQDSADAPFFGRLRVLTPEGGAVRTIREGPIIAFYWSPAGDKIAWVTFDLGDQQLSWWVAPSSGEPARQLFRFQPSADVLIMLSFFDQYNYSHSPWSPSGTHLVVAGVQGETTRGQNGHTPTGDRIFVLEAEGTGEPKELAAGTLAFWSWN
ncbi:MAG: PD40 domain-containing protein [Chloroflexi bacterium]|nr:PD40 domain-containing protein [Chloroflexota bacterium]